MRNHWHGQLTWSSAVAKWRGRAGSFRIIKSSIWLSEASVEKIKRWRNLNHRDRLRENLIQKTKICFIWGVLRLRGPRQRYLQVALMGGMVFTSEIQLEILAWELCIDINIWVSSKCNLSHKDMRQFLRLDIIRKGNGESWREETEVSGVK